jgi:hypothetical protein
LVTRGGKGTLHGMAGILAILVLMAVRPVCAQIQLAVSLEHPAYLTGEAFAARVRIENQLNVPMVFDDEYHNAELLVELIGTRSGMAPESERRGVSRDTVVMPAQKCLELVEITSLFQLREPGGYRLRAGIRYDGRLYLSQPVAFDLVRGVEILSLNRVLSGYNETDLHYSLRFWKRSGSEHAFFVVEDTESGVIYGTFFLGPIVRVNPPVIRFDEQGRAVVVHQSGRNRFTRSVIEVDRNGAELTAQTHHLADGSDYPIKAGHP